MSQSHLRRRKGAQIIVVGLLLSASVCWAVEADPGDAPSPLWTEADLLRVDSQSENGWPVIASAAVVHAPVDLQMLVETPDHEAESFWDRVEQREPSLRYFMALPAVLEANDRVDEARARPSFVAYCDPGVDCALGPWRTLHRVSLVRAIDLAYSGDLSSSCALLRDLIRMDKDALTTSRSALAVRLTLANLDEALNLADLIVQRSDSSEELAELAREVESVNLEAFDLRNVVVAEYLYHLGALDAVERADQDVLDHYEVPVALRWFYSRNSTVQDLNRRFERRYRAAGERDTFVALGGGESSPKQEAGWWLRNPMGKVVVDRAIMEPEQWVASIDQKMVAIGETRSLLLSRPAVMVAAPYR